MSYSKEFWKECWKITIYFVTHYNFVPYTLPKLDLCSYSSFVHGPDGMYSSQFYYLILDKINRTYSLGEN